MLRHSHEWWVKRITFQSNVELYLGRLRNVATKQCFVTLLHPSLSKIFVQLLQSKFAKSVSYDTTGIHIKTVNYGLVHVDVEGQRLMDQICQGRIPT